MNNGKNMKGFSLIELLGTLVVLGIITTITIYSAINIMSGVKEKTYKTTINNIQKEASNYVLEEISATRWMDNDYVENSEYQCVTVQNLIDAGYFKKRLAV